MHLASIALAAFSLFAATAASAGEVSGIVYDSQGRPAADLRVSIAALGLEAVSGADGAYTLADVAPGEHEIAVTLGEGAVQMVGVWVEGEADSRRNIFLLSQHVVRKARADAALGSALSSAAPFAEALEQAKQMSADGPAQGQLAWNWNDLDG